MHLGDKILYFKFLYFSEHSLYALVASEHLSASAQWRTFVIIREVNATNLMASIPRANKDVISHINIVVKHIFFIFTKRKYAAFTEYEFSVISMNNEKSVCKFLGLCPSHFMLWQRIINL